MEGESAEQLLQEAEREDSETLKFLVSDSFQDTMISTGRSYRGIWYNNYYDGSKTLERDQICEAKGWRALHLIVNFTIISISQIVSILENSAIIDA